MRRRSLGPHLPTSAIGLGCMGMSGPYGPADRDESVISVKFGALRDPKGAWLGIDTRPTAVKTSILDSEG